MVLKPPLRSHFLHQALADAKKWCPSPQTLVGGKRSDQFWIGLFSPVQELVTAKDVFCFLVSFQLTNRVTWDKDAVATCINECRGKDPSDIKKAISVLADDLSRCILSKNNGRQISAASKFAFFTHPGQDVYIWDQFAKKSAGFRDGRSAGFDDYASYYDSCAKALEEERQREDFAIAVWDFRDYLRVVGGPMADTRILCDSSFIERRLLDKLMFWEGKWFPRGKSATQSGRI